MKSPNNLNYSDEVLMLIGNLKNFSIEEFEKWFMVHYGVGSANVMEYLSLLESVKKLENRLKELGKDIPKYDIADLTSHLQKLVSIVSIANQEKNVKENNKK